MVLLVICTTISLDRQIAITRRLFSVASKNRESSSEISETRGEKMAVGRLAHGSGNIGKILCSVKPITLNTLVAGLQRLLGTRWYRGANISATVLVRILFRLLRSIALSDKYGMERVVMVGHPQTEFVTTIVLVIVVHRKNYFLLLITIH